MPVYPCRTCGKLTRNPVCDDHKPKRDRPSSSARGYDARWKKTREAFLAVNPVCEWCNAKAEHVHHIDGLGPRGPEGHSWSNLLALCAPCHNSHSAKQEARARRERL